MAAAAGFLLSQIPAVEVGLANRECCPSRMTKRNGEQTRYDDHVLYESKTSFPGPKGTMLIQGITILLGEYQHAVDA